MKYIGVITVWAMFQVLCFLTITHAFGLEVKSWPWLAGYVICMESFKTVFYYIKKEKSK